MLLKYAKENKEWIEYTRIHKLAFRIVERQLLGRNTLRGYFHDTDKLIMYHFMSKKKASKIHKERSKHHIKNAVTEADITQCVIDYECARITKPDKPYSAREYIELALSYEKPRFEPILKKLGL